MAKKSSYESEILTDSIFLILLTMQHPIHGYGIIQNITELTHGRVVIRAATIYTTLKKMKSAGWIQEEKKDDLKTLYHLTEYGNIVLEREYVRRRKMMKYVDELLNKEMRKCK